MTKDHNHYRKKREQEVDKMDSALERFVKKLQGLLWAGVADVIAGLITDSDGNLTPSVRNSGSFGRVGTSIQSVTSQNASVLQRFILRNVTKLFDFNRLFFKSMPDVEPETVEEKVIRSVMTGLGYDVDKKKVIQNSWLDQLSNNSALEQRVGERIRQAIAAKVPLKDFEKELKQEFTGKNGLGYLEQHYKTFVFDLHQQVDRTTQFEYANELKLEYALYSGTIKNNTRPFCRARTGNIYDRKEIASWEKLEFQGKFKTGYNPFIHCGGHNCRHHLSYLSEVVVKRMRKQVNNYN